MVRAATTGKIDFSEIDPYDRRWWKRLAWVLEEMELEMMRDSAQLAHTHWLEVAHLVKDKHTREHAFTQAETAMQRYLAATYPWMANELLKDAGKTSVEHAVDAYHEVFGKPGEPRYEQMLSELKTGLRKLSRLEKLQARAKRRKERAAMAAGA